MQYGITYKFRVLLAVFGLFAQSHARGAQMVEIRGHYTAVNLFGGRSPTERNTRVDFVATLGENAWMICATNRQNAEWEVLTFDGTNTYYLMPFSSHFNPSGADKKLFGTPKSDAALFGAINTGAHYSMPSMSHVEMFLPWMVYCLPPQGVSSNMPLPWSNYTRNLEAYGWRWNVTPSANGKFIGAFKVIRDSSFDLSEKNELLRSTLEYPRTAKDLNWLQTTLASRKLIPDGLEGATYVCKEWYKTNNMAIPADVEFRKNLFAGNAKKSVALQLISALKVDQIILKEDTIKVPELTEAAYVRDYRYTLKSENRLYPFAEYAQSGDWKFGNDQELLAQRDNYLRHGPKIGNYGFGSGLLKLSEKSRRVLVWLLLGITQVIALAILVRVMVETQRNKGKERNQGNA